MANTNETQTTPDGASPEDAPPVALEAPSPLQGEAPKHKGLRVKAGVRAGVCWIDLPDDFKIAPRRPIGG